MKLLKTSAAALLATTALAHAGGVDRTVPSTAILFEDGTYAELGYTILSPDVSGSVGGGALQSGDMAANQSYGVLRFHHDFSDALSLSVMLDSPIGADVSYPVGTGYPFAGSTAEVTSEQLTAALRYELANNVSIYGGLRVLAATGDAYVSTAGFAYLLSVSSDYELGYMVGAAYERPEIALRVALTYYSAVDLTMTGGEGADAPGTPAGAIATGGTSFDVTIPQMVHLEAQSGIAEDTLLFGSVRWTEWTEFSIAPPVYVGTVGSPLVSYADDVWTYTLGVGRRINENWSVSGTITHEAQTGSPTGNLGPRDGLTSVGLGAEYTNGNISVAGGLQHIWVGDATTTIGADFSDNTAVAGGIRIGLQF